jgi:glycosyltransferase involved in cell wall biosynthesis
MMETNKGDTQQQPFPIFIDSEIRVLEGSAAVERLSDRNDLKYFTESGILQVDQARWQEAQQYERKTWMTNLLHANDNRNHDHQKNFRGYQTIAGRAFNRVIELGCGPFTNLRLILPHIRAEHITLLDPLIKDYLTHPHCTYRAGCLLGVPVETVACPIEDFYPVERYDLVVMANVLEHCYDVPAIFQRIIHCLKPGGNFVFGENVFRQEQLKVLLTVQFDAGHPIRVTDQLLTAFLQANFAQLYHQRLYGQYNQPQRIDVYYIGIYHPPSVEEGHCGLNIPALLSENGDDDPQKILPEMPLISVLVSTYKSERFIRGCLEDLESQTIADKIEIIIVDSASPEKEQQIVEEFQTRYNNIVYLRTDERESLYQAWNRALKIAKGRYITNANTDDRHRIDAFEILSRTLDQNKDVALVYGDCYVSKVPNQTFADNQKSQIYRYPDYFGPAALLHYQFGPQPMWRREIHRNIGGFDKTFKAAGDYDFNIRFAAQYKALHVHDILGSYLIHGEAISYADSTMAQENKRLADTYHTPSIIEKIYKRIGLTTGTDAERAEMFLDLGLRALEYYPPWRDGNIESNIALAYKCFTWAIESDSKCIAARCNLSCLFAWEGRLVEAKQLLKENDTYYSHPSLLANARKICLFEDDRTKSLDLDLMASGLGFPSQSVLARRGLGFTNNSSQTSMSGQTLNICIVANMSRIDPLGPNGGMETALLHTAIALAYQGHKVAITAKTLSLKGRFKGVQFLEYEKWLEGHFPEFSSNADLLAITSGPNLQNYNHVPKSTARVVLCHHQELHFLGGDRALHFLNKETDQVICVSVAVRSNLVRDGVRPDHLTVVPNGIDNSVFYPHPVVRRSARILYAGALVPDKNPHLLISAFLEISPIVPEAELYICGSAALWGMTEYIDQDLVKKLNPKIYFRGLLRPEEMVNEYSLASICVIPSKFESFSLASIEAQACGCVPLVARTGGLPETLIPNQSGFIYEPNTKEALKAALLKLLGDPKTLNAASQCGPKFIRNTFSWDRVAVSYGEVFLRAVTKSASRRARAETFAAGAIEPRSSESLRSNKSFLINDDYKPEPLVSVVIPCYNYAHFLSEAVESVLKQSFQYFEIIIVNDGSTDHTVSVAGDLISRYSGRYCIRLVDQSNSGQPAAARNAGIAIARGQFILPLDADDQIAPTFLQKTVNLLIKHPQVGVVYTHIQHFGILKTIFKSGDFSTKALAQDNVIPYASLFRKSLWDDLGGYRLNIGYEDWDFWLNLAERGVKGKLVQEPLFLYRKHGFSHLESLNKRRDILIAQLQIQHPRLYSNQELDQARQLLNSVHDEHDSQTKVMGGTRRLRITYLISSILGVTGGNQTLLGHVNGLSARGHEVTIVTNTAKPKHTPIFARIIRVPDGQRMAECVPECDVVIATYFINAIELQFIDVPVKVYYAQGDQYIFSDSSLKGAEHEHLKRLSDISYQINNVFFMPNSLNLANAVLERNGRLAAAVLPVMVNRDIFRPTPRVRPPTTWRILVVGPDSPGTAAEPLGFKGIGDSLKALELLGNRVNNFKVVRMSGSPPQIFANYRCDFYQAPTNLLKTEIFASADILIYASHYDSCPRPPLEAMSAGCAVVCTNTSGAREYCEDGSNCRMVPIQNPEAIADAVNEIMSNRNFWQKIVQGGLNTAHRLDECREIPCLEEHLFQFQKLSNKSGELLLRKLQSV